MAEKRKKRQTKIVVQNRVAHSIIQKVLTQKFLAIWMIYLFLSLIANNVNACI